MRCRGSGDDCGRQDAEHREDTDGILSYIIVRKVNKSLESSAASAIISLIKLIPLLITEKSFSAESRPSRIPLVSRMKYLGAQSDGLPTLYPLRENQERTLN
jgi:hypothetical protein